MAMEVKTKKQSRLKRFFRVSGKVFCFLNPFYKGRSDSIEMRFRRLLFKYKRLVFTSLLCMVGYNLFNAAPALYIKDIIDALSSKPELEKFFLVGGGVVLVFGLKGLFAFGQSFAMGLVVQRLVRDLRKKLFEHLQTLSPSFFSRFQTGDVVARFTNDTASLQDSLNVSITGPIRDIPAVILFFIIMVYRSWELCLVTLLVLPPAAMLIQLFGRKNGSAVETRQKEIGSLGSFLTENVMGIRIVQAFGMEKYEISLFKKHNKGLFRSYMRTIRIESLSSPCIEVVGAVVGAAVLAYGGFLIREDQMTVGDLASFVTSFLMINAPLKKINKLFLKIQEGLASLKRIYTILDHKPEIYDAQDAVDLQSLQKNIQIQVNQFSYWQAPKPTLQNIHLTVNKGEVIALVGGSGSGKSTLTNLILRFFEVSDGNILIDGVDITKIKLQSLRKLIALVTQETVLFNDSIANNICYGKPNCTEEEMIDAARSANAHHFIEQLHDGYQTMIGERGMVLSGGQRQRISIARAILKDAPILILDEATSALDSESEIAVQEALDHLMENRTTIVVAHRLSTIRHADRICVLENGQMVEIGSHQELMQNKGRYHQLYGLQFG